MRKLTWVTLLTLAMVAAAVAAPPRERASVVDTEQMIFASGGTIELRDSFGQVEIEGWDQAEIELTIEKSTQKRYAPEEMERAVKDLDRITISTERLADNHIVITTDFPSRNLFTRPLRGKSNLDLKYRIRAPRQTQLVIRHDIGDVMVRNVIGNMEITNRIGEIALRVPEEEHYVIDAKTHIGDVCAEDPSARSHLVGASLIKESEPPAYRLFLRVGIGDICVKKLRLPPPEETVD